MFISGLQLGKLGWGTILVQIATELALVSHCLCQERGKIQSNPTSMGHKSSVEKSPTKNQLHKHSVRKPGGAGVIQPLHLTCLEAFVSSAGV